MIRKTIVAFAALAVLSTAAATGAVAPGGEANHARAGEVTKLFDKAVAKVRKKPEFSKAIMLEADGIVSGVGEKARDVNKWRFALDNQKTGNEFLSVSIVWKRGKGFSKPKGVEEPFLEDYRMQKPPKMTLSDAIRLLKQAGFSDGFENVTLRRPIGPGKKPPPLYIFGVEQGGFVAVNTKNGSVSELE